MALVEVKYKCALQDNRIQKTAVEGFRIEKDRREIQSKDLNKYIQRKRPKNSNMTRRESPRRH